MLTIQQAEFAHCLNELRRALRGFFCPRGYDVYQTFDDFDEDNCLMTRTEPLFRVWLSRN